jgi:hypothetical protein
MIAYSRPPAGGREIILSVVVPVEEESGIWTIWSSGQSGALDNLELENLEHWTIWSSGESGALDNLELWTI